MPVPAGMVQNLRGGLTTWLVPRRYSPVPNTLDPDPPSDPNADPEIDGETGTWRGAGTTSGLLGFKIGAGATYGAGGLAPTEFRPTENGRERQTANACEKHGVILTCRDPVL